MSTRTAMRTKTVVTSGDEDEYGDENGDSDQDGY